jgi:bacterioferritin-associated ferredoxin
VLEGLDAKLAEVTTSALTDEDMVEQVSAQTTAATFARVLHHSGVMACGACCNHARKDFLKN